VKLLLQKQDTNKNNSIIDHIKFYFNGFLLAIKHKYKQHANTIAKIMAAIDDC